MRLGKKKEIIASKVFLPLPLFPPPLSFFTLIFALHPAVFLLRKCLLKNGHPQRANLTPRNPQDPFTLFLESRFLEGLVTSVQFYKHPSLPISQREIINKMSTVCELIDVFVVASVSVLRSPASWRCGAKATLSNEKTICHLVARQNIPDSILSLYFIHLFFLKKNLFEAKMHCTNDK